MKKKSRAKEKPMFKAQEMAIIRTIGRHRRPLSVNEIAEESRLSWATVKKYAEKLYSEGVIAVKVTRKGKIIHRQKTPKYQLNYAEIYGKAKMD
jgi:Mn-dependent DtxR family transcriptional regulator